MPKSLLDDYLLYLEESKNFSPYTIKNYRFDILEFYEYSKTFLNFKDSDALRYLQHISTLKNNSIHVKIATIKAFYKYLKIREYSFNEYFLKMRNIKKEKLVVEYLTEEEILELLNIEITNNLGINLRNKAIVSLLYSSGIRLSELVSLDVFDYTKDSFTVIGKGNKERICFLNDYCKEDLKNYLTYFNLKDGPLFINKNGDRLSNRSVEDILKKMGLKMRLPKKVYPHMIRHSFATHLMNRGCDIRVIQELLGHDCISSTQVYSHVSMEKIKEVYRKVFSK